MCLALSHTAFAADLIVSANDGKFVRVDGRATFPQPAAPDSLSVIDASQFPPTIKATIEGIEHTLQGPPQAVAITPDGKLVVIGAPSRYDYEAKKESFGQFLQVVDLEASPPQVLGRVDIGGHPQGLSISPDGKLLLAASVDGTVKVVTIVGKTLTLVDTVKVATKRLSGLTITHDGKAALVALRDEGGLATLSIDGTQVKDTGERISTGLAPYAIDVDSNGQYAVVGNAGLAGLAGYTGKMAADADTVTLIDVSARPFRAIQHLSVAALPEAAAISPDGKWVAVQSMNGSNLTPDNARRNKLGKVTLFAIENGQARRVSELPGGEAAQGIVFTKDSRNMLVQFDVEKALAVYGIRNGQLVDTQERLKLGAGPVSIRSMPR
jgi:DNA-binding beta-propeller fold protein YncE